jgi:hypothetical protein
MLLLTITFANWKRMGTNEAEKAVTVVPLKGTLAEVESFYSRCGYQGGVSPKDTVITATEGDLIIGVVRLCEEEGVTVLRGMQVTPYRRRMGSAHECCRTFVSWLGSGLAGGSRLRI